MAAVAWDSVVNTNSTVSYEEWNKMRDRIKSDVVVAQDDSGNYKGSTHVAIQAAIDAVNILGGGTVHVKAGTYNIGTKINVYDNINLIGDGVSTILATSGNNILLEISSVSNVTIKDMYLDGATQTDNNSAMRVISLATATKCHIENVEVVNGGYYGINLFDSSNCVFINVRSHDNYRHGYHLGGDHDNTNEQNIFLGCYAYSNGNCGFNNRGNNGTPHSILDRNIFKGCFAYSNTYDGFVTGNSYFDIFDGCNSFNNGHDGITLASTSSYGKIINCNSYGNTNTGISTGGTKGIVLGNVSLTNGTNLWDAGGANVTDNNITA